MKKIISQNRKTLIAVIGIIAAWCIITGVTYAWFSYSRNGTNDNTITSGSITFHYEEGNRQISVQDAMPMTDVEGKRQTDYFDFEITSNTSRTVDIPYSITVRKTDDSDEILDNVVKVYLTKVDDNGVETEVVLSKLNQLSRYQNSEINLPEIEKQLYTDTVLAGTRGYKQKYRLRMWIDTTAQYIVQQEGEEDSYPYQGKTYTLKVNVYGVGNDIGTTEANYRSSTEITELTVGGTELTSTDSTNYTANYTLLSNTETKTIEIETEKYIYTNLFAIPILPKINYFC